MYYLISPEVGGGLGSKTVCDRSVHPPIVTFLEYEFDVWLGDDLIEGFPCFIVTDRLRGAIEKNHLTGCTFAEVLVTTSDTFRELDPDLELPTFYWLKVGASVGKDDFGRTDSAQLVISSKALDVLRLFKIEHTKIEEFNLTSTT